MDLTELFCNMDDFCQEVVKSSALPELPDRVVHRQRQGGFSLSEVMTILVYFHQSHGYRNFKGYYTHYVLKHLKAEFPQAVSYTRFVELIPRALVSWTSYLLSRRGQPTGMAFVDATPLRVCHNLRIRSHKVFRGVAGRSKTSIGWFFGLKLHRIINDQGELLALQVTPGNSDDRKPVFSMLRGLFGKLFGDKGCISQALFLFGKTVGVELITTLKKKMKPRLRTLMDRILLRKRSLIESVNDQLKNVSQIEHSRHRSVLNALTHLLAGLVAYTYHPAKPQLQLSDYERNCLLGYLNTQLLTL